MLGCAVLKAAMTFANVFSVEGSSPPPRQQNHLTVTGPPGGTVSGPLGEAEATAAVEALGEADAAAVDGLAFPPPHAPNASAATASKAVRRMNGVRMVSS